MCKLPDGLHCIFPQKYDTISAIQLPSSIRAEEIRSTSMSGHNSIKLNIMPSFMGSRGNFTPYKELLH